jgi:hypothetical protein
MAVTRILMAQEQLAEKSLGAPRLSSNTPTNCTPWKLLLQMWKFTYEETIDAQIERVFHLISDFSISASWNPFVISASGPAELGGVIRGTVKMGIFKIPFRHKIFEYVHNKSVCWRDFGLIALLFYCGQRCRYVEARGDKVHYKCEIQVSGPLSGLASLIVGRALRNGVIAETRALKYEAEKVTVS